MIIIIRLCIVVQINFRFYCKILYLSYIDMYKRHNLIILIKEIYFTELFNLYVAYVKLEKKMCKWNTSPWRQVELHEDFSNQTKNTKACWQLEGHLQVDLYLVEESEANHHLSNSKYKVINISLFITYKQRHSNTKTKIVIWKRNER